MVQKEKNVGEGEEKEQRRSAVVVKSGAVERRAINCESAAAVIRRRQDGDGDLGVGGWPDGLALRIRPAPHKKSPRAPGAQINNTILFPAIPA